MPTQNGVSLFRQSYIATGVMILWLLLCVSLGSLREDPLAQQLGRFALTGAMCLAPLLVLLGQWRGEVRTFPWPFAIGCACLMLLYLGRYEAAFSYMANLRRALQVAVFGTVFCAFYGAGFSQLADRLARLMRASVCLGLLSVVGGALWVGFDFQGWAMGFQNPNVAAMAVFLAWPILSSRHTKYAGLWIGLVTLVVALLVGTTSSRSVILGVLIGAFVFGIAAVMSSPLRRLIGFIALMMVSPVIVLSAVSKFWLRLFDFDKWFISFMNKSLFSSRDEIWGQALAEIGKSPLLGAGGGATMTIAEYGALSIHNLFLQVTYQVGLLGLVVLIWILYALWRPVAQWSSDHGARVAMGAFAGMMVIQIFEVTLTQNNMALSLPFWAILGFVSGDVERRRGSRR